MSTLNVRLAGILVGIVVILGAGVYVLHGVQMRNNADFFKGHAETALENAKEAEAAAGAALKNAQEDEAAKKNEEALTQYIEAQKYFGWYARLRPADWDAIESLGLIQAHLLLTPQMRAALADPQVADRLLEAGISSRQLYGQARKNLEELVRQDPSRMAARRKLVDLLTLRGPGGQVYEPAAAREHLQNYLLKQSPKDAELLELLGECLAQLGGYDAAVASFQKAIEYAPDRLSAYDRLATLLRRRLNKPQQADAWMDKLVENNPESVAARVAAGQYWLGAGSLEKATEQAAKALELGPDDPDALLLSAACATQNGIVAARDRNADESQKQFEQARKYAGRVVELRPREAKAYTTLADVEARAGNPDAAVAALEKGLGPTKNAPELVWALANELIDVDRLDDAKRQVERLRDTTLPADMLEFLDGRIALREHDWPAARDHLESARAGMATRPQFQKQVDFWLGQCYAQLGQTDQQMRALRRAVETDPFLLPAREALVDALLRQGKLGEALAEYRPVLNRLSPEARLRVATLMIVQNARLPQPQRDWPTVDRVLDTLEQAMPDSVEVAVLRAQSLSGQGKPAEAEDLLRQTVAKHPDSSLAWNQLISWAMARQDWDQTEKLLGEAEQKLGDTAEVRMARARYLVRRNGDHAATDLAKLAEKIDGFPPDGRMRLLDRLLDLAAEIGDADLQERLAGQLIAEDPKNVTVRFKLLELALRNRDQAKIDKTLAELHKVEGDGPMWHVGEAVRLTTLAERADDPRLDEALGHLAAAGKLRPSWGRVALLEGEVYYKQGKLDDALKRFQKAIAMGDRNVVGIQRAMEILARQGRFSEARDMMALLEGRDFELSPDTERIVNFLKDQEDPDAALEGSRRIAANSQNYIDHLQLGERALRKAQRLEDQDQSAERADLLQEAGKAFRRAAELAPGQPAVWLSLVRYCALTGQKAEALRAIAQAEGQLPENLSALVLAQCYALAGELDMARAQYDKALAARPDDPAVVRAVAEFYLQSGDRAVAEGQLRRILDGKIKAGPEDVRWARSAVAAILADRGGYAGLRQALQLIDRNLASDADSERDLRLKATILASMPGRANRRQAIATLEDLVKAQQQPLARDRYQLARLYLDDGQYGKYTAEMQSLIIDNSDRAEYLAAYVAALLEHDELQNAELYLDRLAKLAPHAIGTATLQAELLFRRGQHEAAAKLLREFADDPQSEPADPVTRLGLVAGQIDKFARRLAGTGDSALSGQLAREAEMMYRRYFDQKPDAQIMLAPILVRQGQISEALTLIENRWAQTPPAMVADVVNTLVTDEQVTAEQLKRAEQVMNDALRQFNRPAVLMKVMATLYTVEERYKDAEDVYRQIIERKSDSAMDEAIARNNLAVLLAMQGVKLQEAMALINRAIELAGPMGSMLDSRGTVYMALKQPQKAIVDFQAAIDDSPSPVRLYHLAEAYDRAGDAPKARETMKRAVDAGLTRDMLEPLERPGYAAMMRKLPK